MTYAATCLWVVVVVKAVRTGGLCQDIQTANGEITELSPTTGEVRVRRILPSAPRLKGTVLGGVEREVAIGERLLRGGEMERVVGLDKGLSKRTGVGV